MPPNASPFARKVLTAIFSGNLPDLQQAYAENPLEFSHPGVGALLLNVACREGHPEIVAWLLGLGCDPTEPYLRQLPLSMALGLDTITLKERIARDPAVAAMLQSLAQKGRVSLTAEMISSLAKSGLGPRIAEIAFSPAPPEVLTRKQQVVELLLARGAEVRTADGTSLVAQAVRTGFGGAFVRRLVEAGADPAAMDANLRANALHIAAFQGNLSAATALLDCGVRLDALSFPLPPDLPLQKTEPTGGGNTPLMFAIVRGQIEMVRLLLERGADPNDVNLQKFTALHVAARGGTPEIVSLLLAHHCRPNAASTLGITPLHLTAISGDVASTRMLCDAGAAIDLADSAGYTAFLWAVERDQTGIIDFLLARGANRHATSNDRKTALRVAAMTGALHAIDFLLTHGDPVEGFPNDVMSPLQEAVCSGHPAAVKLLVERGAHPDRAARASSLSPPLIAALRATAQASAARAAAAKNGALYQVVAPDEDNCVAVMRILLDAGATVDITGPRRDTALHIAAEHGFQKVTALLLEHGARTDLANAGGLTALELARKTGQTATADLIAHDTRDRN